MSLTSVLFSFYVFINESISVNYLQPFLLSECFDVGSDLENGHVATR